MRVFVSGASGFVGSAVIEELASRRHLVNALVHSRPIGVGGESVRSIRGDIFDPRALDEAMRGCEAAIHLVGIIMEKPSRGVTFQRMHVDATRAVVDAAIRNGIRRYLHMAALGTRADAVSNYHKTKYAAEQYVRGSGLDWTIFRPSLIHGPRGEFMKMEAAWARKKAPPFLFMPYFGRGLMGFGGAGKLQPIYVGDVARAFVDALENPKTIGEVYPIAGPDVLTWPELHRVCAEAFAGHRRWVMPMPVWNAKFLCALGVAPLLGFNRDQVIMSQEDNTTDITKFRDDFAFDPAGFEPTVKQYSSLLRYSGGGAGVGVN